MSRIFQGLEARAQEVSAPPHCDSWMITWMSTDGVFGWQGFFCVSGGLDGVRKWSAGLQLS